MSWRSRDDLFYGLALLRPVEESSNVQFGGAYVSFWVRGETVSEAVEALERQLREYDWILSSLDGLKRACDYENEEAEEGVEAQIADADLLGVALRPFHTFPLTDELPS